jgi:hypothetical protein
VPQIIFGESSAAVEVSGYHHELVLPVPDCCAAAGPDFAWCRPASHWFLKPGEPASDLAPRPARKRRRLSRSEKSSAPATYEIHRRQQAKLKPRASGNPILDIPPAQYQQLVTWSAARLKGQGKLTKEAPTAISETLQEVGVNVAQWMTSITAFETKCHSAVGTASHLEKFIQRAERSFIHGIRACRAAFT